MTFKFNKILYSKEALIKASYKYIDDFYLHIDCDELYYFVDIEPKNENDISEKEFLNELLIQQTRELVYEKTSKLREIMYARAMASTVLDDINVDDIENDEEYNAEEILVDWFDEYEE